MKIADLYDSVTATIIRELDQGAIPWTKPWSRRGPKMPINFATRRPYSGVNVLILWATSQTRLYPTMEYLTFKQALEAGGCVRKGETSTPIVFAKQIAVGQDEEHERLIGMLKVFHVFNVAQVDGLPIGGTPELENAPRTAVSVFVERSGAKVVEGYDEAFFSPARDVICMPYMSQFRGDGHYHATMLHELTHWSGHRDRLARDLSGRFGSQSYAAEELVAELGAAFLCAHLGVEGQLRHAGYIADWMALLKEDNRAIFTASAKAQQAADYLRALADHVA